MPAKHTPGPWALSRPRYKDGSVVTDSEGFVSISAPTHVDLARVVWRLKSDEDAGRRPNPTLEANARLIVAAPDMLAALKALIPRFDRGDDHDIAPSIVASVRAAIAKAEGAT